MNIWTHREWLTPAVVPAVAVALVAAFGSIGCDQPATSAAEASLGIDNRQVSAAAYRVTVTNTTGALQPLTPAAVALHNRAADVFEVGTAASEAVERVAESGDVPFLVSALEEVNQVFDVGVAFGTVEGENGPILPEASGSVEIQGPAGKGMRLSVVSMLVCSNDGFTGLDAMELPEKVGETTTYMSDGYDAGTEQNTEAKGDLVPPCVEATTGEGGGTGADQPPVAEDDVIRHHPGISSATEGDDILGETHQWTDPVATIEIERIN
jgi:hypothetical protein